MEIHSYYSQSGTDLIEKYISSLTTVERIDARRVLDQLEEGQMDTLTVKHWFGKIMEIYFYKHNRIFYVTSDADNLYLLHTCRKQKNKTEKRDSKIVISRAKQLSKELGKKFI
jgi:Phage-related protein